MNYNTQPETQHESQPNLSNNPLQNKVNIWMIVSLVLMGFIAAILLFPYISNYSKPANSELEQLTDTNTTSTQKNIPVNQPTPQFDSSPTKSQVISQKTLADAIRGYCKNGKIMAGALPFKMLPEIVNRYKLPTDKNEPLLTCYTYDSNEVDSGYIVLERKASIGKVNNSFSRYIYIYDDASAVEGMYDPLDDLSFYQDIMIGQQNYFFKVLEPGPYGISTLGTEVILLAEYDLQDMNTLIRYSSSIFYSDDSSINNIIKKYGKKIESPEDESIYALVDDQAKQKFLADLKQYLKNNIRFKQAADDILTDIKSVSYVSN